MSTSLRMTFRRAAVRTCDAVDNDNVIFYLHRSLYNLMIMTAAKIRTWLFVPVCRAGHLFFVTVDLKRSLPPWAGRGGRNGPGLQVICMTRHHMLVWPSIL